MSDWNQKLKEARDLFDNGSYRNAYLRLNEAREMAQAQGDLFNADDLEQALESAMQEGVNSARTELNTLLQDDLQMDVATARQTLSRWQQSVTDTSNAEYQRYEEEVNVIEKRQHEESEYQLTKQRVENLWQQARTAMDEGATTTAILDIVTRALDIASSAFNRNQSNSKLRLLKEDAEKFRDRIGNEQQAMLSGAQAEQFEISLKHIQNTPLGETIPTYDMNRQLIGRLPKQAAQEELVKQAKLYVNRKIEQYIAKADDYLSRELPIDARQELVRIDDKFAELIALVQTMDNSDLLEANTKISLRQIEDELRLAEEQWQQAEEVAQRASEQAHTDPISAWETYKRAISIYPTASKSDIFLQTRSIIQREIENYLDTQIELLNAKYQSADPESYFDGKMLKDILRELNQIEKKVQNIDLTLNDRLRRLQEMQERINHQNTSVKRIKQTIQGIEQHLSRPDKADKDLRELEITTDRELLSAYANYNDLRGRINRLVDEQAELERLQGFLTSTNANRVKDAHADAETAAQESRSYQEQFFELAQQLDAYYTLLQVDYVVYRDGYDQAIQSLQPYENNAQLPDSLRQQISDKLGQLRVDSENIGTDEQNMQLAEEALNRNQPKQAHSLLESVQHFATSQDRVAYNRLFNRAKSEWAKDIIKEIDQLDIEQDLDAPQVRQLLNDLMRLNPQQAELYRRRITVLEGVQLAKDELANNNYHTAKNQLNAINPDATGRERIYIREILEYIDRQTIRISTDELVGDLQRALPDSAEYTQAMADLIDKQSEIRDMIKNASSDLAYVEFSTWLIQLTLIRAEFIDNFELRRKTFDEALAVASKLDRKLKLIKDDSILDAAKHEIKKANLGPALSDAIRDVEANVQEDTEFGLFSEAIENIEGVLSGYENDFVTLYNWYSDKRNLMRDQIRAKIHKGQTNTELLNFEPQVLPLYAKLLVLNPQDDLGLKMLFGLPELAQKITVEVEQLHAQIFDSDAIGNDAQADQSLDNDIKTISSQLNIVKLIQSVAKRFSNIMEDTEDDMSYSLSQATAQANSRLSTYQQHLSRLKILSSEFRMAIQNIDLVNDDDQALRSVGRQLDENWDRFYDSVTEIHDGLVNHPIVRRLEVEKDEQKKHINQLINLLIEIRQVIQEEDFIRAEQLSNSEAFENKRKFFKNTSLYANFTVTDIINHNRVVGWENVSNLIEARLPWQQTIRDWSQVFDVPQAILDGDDSYHAPLQPASDVVNWDAESQRIENTFLSQGDFDKGIPAIQCCINGTGCEQTQYSLQEAIDIIENAPIVMKDQVGSLANAKRHAGSERGKRIIQWVEDHRLTGYKQDLLNAQNTLSQAQKRQEVWQSLLQEQARIIGDIAETLEGRRSFLGRQIDKAALRSEIEKYQSMLYRMRTIAPTHPDISHFENDTDYQIALSKIN